jgi:hypothetical protein
MTAMANRNVRSTPEAKASQNARVSAFFKARPHAVEITQEVVGRLEELGWKPPPGVKQAQAKPTGKAQPPATVAAGWTPAAYYASLDAPRRKAIRSLAKEFSSKSPELAELRAKLLDFAWSAPTPEEYAAFYIAETVPAWNGSGNPLRRCIACGKLFAPEERSDLYCGFSGRGCQKAAEQRRGNARRRKKTGDRLAEARQIAETELRKEHFERKPPHCSQRDPCERAVELLEGLGLRQAKHVRAKVVFVADPHAEQEKRERRARGRAR